MIINVFNILKSFIDKILAFTNKSDIKRVGVSQFDFIKERLKCILLKNKNEYSSCPWNNQYQLKNWLILNSV